MTDRELKEKLSSLTEEQERIITEYCSNDMRKLKNVCHRIWHGKVDDMECNELYDVATDCLMETVVSYDNQKAKFETFLCGNIIRKTNTWMRDNKYRLKRSNLLKDANGKLILDEDEKPQIIMNISLDANTDEVSNIKDNLHSRENIEEDIFAEEYTDKVELYLQQLPRKQERVARLLSQQYKAKEILEILHITSKEYNEQLQGLRKYEYISILF